MHLRNPANNIWSSLRLISVHVAITLLAVGIALTLPTVARYILFQWWPRVQDDSEMLLLSEVVLAALLVALFHLMRLTWDGRRKARLGAIASLVHARDTTSGWLSRWVEKDLMRASPWKRDLFIMSITGRDTFGAVGAELHDALKDCHEVRVMLLNPHGYGARTRAKSLRDPESVIDRYRGEADGSIGYLRELHAAGKKVSLKLYDDPPFWKLVFVGDQVWVQYCHDGRDTRDCPEYVFALQPDRPERGFFPAFFSYFLNQWDDPRHPEYDFETDELVYRNPDAAEPTRMPYPRHGSASPPGEANRGAELVEAQSEAASGLRLPDLGVAGEGVEDQGRTLPPFQGISGAQQSMDPGPRSL
jgi:hypothetical protein